LGGKDFSEKCSSGFLFDIVCIIVSKRICLEEKHEEKTEKYRISFLFLEYDLATTISFCQSIPQLSFAFSNPDNSVKDFGLLQWVDAYLAVFERERPFLYPLWFLKDLFVLNIFAVIIRKVMENHSKNIAANRNYTVA